MYKKPTIIYIKLKIMIIDQHEIPEKRFEQPITGAWAGDVQFTASCGQSGAFHRGVGAPEQPGRPVQVQFGPGPVSDPTSSQRLHLHYWQEVKTLQNISFRQNFKENFRIYFYFLGSDFVVPQITGYIPKYLMKEQ